jgi:hypothetical protein
MVAGRKFSYASRIPTLAENGSYFVTGSRLGNCFATSSKKLSAISILVSSPAIHSRCSALGRASGAALVEASGG